ncbi:MAG: histidine phosphatase family protein [Candidatus Eremiobacteraeota bacterium]|nr:histidine phosphatase family protein [Candidatus Eremiobacteraeota bacterium]
MKLLLVRHGESTWNVEGRYQGRRDAPLSPRGRAQAEALAARLCDEQAARPNDKRVAAIVSSPLARAHDTAQICARALGLSVKVDERLTEISHGQWEGKLGHEVASLWPDMVAAWRSRPHEVRFPGGETLQDVRSRFVSFVSTLQDDAEPLLATTHDVIVRIALLIAQGKPLSAFNDVRVDNAALNEFSVDGDKLAVVRINDTTHLGSLRSDTLTQAL